MKGGCVVPLGLDGWLGTTINFFWGDLVRSERLSACSGDDQRASCRW